MREEIQLFQERKFSHGFYDGRKISFDKKNLKRFWLREIFKTRVADGLYNNLVHELQIRDREFRFK